MVATNSDTIICLKDIVVYTRSAILSITFYEEEYRFDKEVLLSKRCICEYETEDIDLINYDQDGISIGI